MSIALCLTCVLVLGGANVDAQPAAGAIVGRDLDRELPAGILLALVVGRLEARRGASSNAGSKTFMRIVAWGQPSEQSPHWMQIFGSQIGNVLGDAPLLVLRGARGERAVDRASR